MTNEERTALETEQADLVRKRKKRLTSPGYAGSVALIDERLAEIATKLAAPPEPEPEAPSDPV